MTVGALEEKIKRHRAFWNRENVDRPLVGFTIGSYFPVHRYEAAHNLAEENKRIDAEDINAEAFIDDYERLYGYSAATDQDVFWVAEPFTGIPWMESFFGCGIYGNRDSMRAEPLEIKNINDLENIPPLDRSPWYEKYIEFTSLLSGRSGGRYPVGQPILRGISDTIGAMVGQEELVYYFYDEPELMKRLCRNVNSVFLQVIEEQQNSIPAFLGGYSMGFYDLWCPGKCVWFQEDLTSLLSPDIYREYILECNREVCHRYEYNAIHLHPSSFYILDDLLNIKNLKVIEINKDVGGPSVEEMVPLFKRVLEKKRLCIWGDLDEKDIYAIKKSLPFSGLFLNIVSPGVAEANALMKFIKG